MFSAVPSAAHAPLPQATSGIRSSGEVAEAQSLLSRGTPQEAIQLLSHHLQSYPKDTAARLLLAEAYAIAGQNDRALEQYQEVVRLAPDNYIALAALGEMYNRTGDLEKAEPILARAARLSGAAPQVRIEWATVLARLHRYKEAAGALESVLPPRARAERVAFYRLKASVAAGLGNLAAASSEMEKALALSPDDAGLRMATAAAQVEARNWQRAASLAGPLFSSTRDPRAGLVLLEARLGMHQEIGQTLESLRAITMPAEQELVFRQRVAQVLIAHGEFLEAVEELKKAAELAPSRADMLYDLALSQLRAGRLDEALDTAEKCKALGDNAQLEDLLADIEEGRGDNLAAVRSYQAAVALAPNEEKYRLSLALELIRHKSFEPAKIVLKQAEELHPSSWRIQLALGMVEYFAGTDQEASRILVRAAELAPEPATALRYLGDIQMDQASAPDPAALKQLCQYADQHPKSGKEQFYCGALLFRKDHVSGDKSHSAEILQRLNTAVHFLPEDASPHCQLGKAYRWMERWQDALRESEICAGRDAESADAHYRLAQIYQHLGQRERSQEEMRLYNTASQRQADENARRDKTIKTFLYTIQNESPVRR